MLDGWLEFHRGTLITKCAGLTDEQLRLRSVEPSGLSLLGLLRHMTEVELWWFDTVFSGGPLPKFYSTPEDRDADFHDTDGTTGDEAFANWTAACAQARQQVEGKDLDQICVRPDTEISLRWIFIHMIEEYARHNGHADLLRERIDGATGD